MQRKALIIFALMLITASEYAWGNDDEKAYQQVGSLHERDGCIVWV
jgi:hypothetical protein